MGDNIFAEVGKSHVRWFFIESPTNATMEIEPVWKHIGILLINILSIYQAVAKNVWTLNRKKEKECLAYCLANKQRPYWFEMLFIIFKCLYFKI